MMVCARFSGWDRVRADGVDAATWSPKISELVEKGTVGLRPFDLELDYDYWNYCELLWLRLW